MDEGKTSEDTAHTEAVNMISNAVKSDILTGEFMGLTHFGANIGNAAFLCIHLVSNACSKGGGGGGGGGVIWLL